MNYLKDLSYFSSLKNVAVFGSSGSIGSAFVEDFAKLDSIQNIFTFSRTKPLSTSTNETWNYIDYSDEHTIESAKEKIDSSIAFDLIIIATGALHVNDKMPEKSISQYKTDNAQLFYLLNTIGPSLIMKHFSPMLNKLNPSIIGTLCARIGSISDNRLGGWYSYRASKAALSMMIKSISIELTRKNANSICVGLHPGTVDSKLSQPFQKHINPKSIINPHQSVEQLLTTLSKLTPQDTGYQFAYDGSKIES